MLYIALHSIKSRHLVGQTSKTMATHAGISETESIKTVIKERQHGFQRKCEI